jgi:D-serine deaminase-like pyridoxal phosphate-dependent protein
MNETLQALRTPCLLLDEERMTHNITRLKTRLSRLGVSLNPHVKTAKCIEIARRLAEHPQGPCTVSTLEEAEHLAAAGFRKILYAVGIVPNKLPRVVALRKRGIDIAVLVDSPEQARAVTASSRAESSPIATFIEIDSDGHRSGVHPENRELLLAIAREIHTSGAELRGVLTHAGESYSCRGKEALEAMAEQERSRVVAAATVLRSAGLPCPVVSAGSTPTAHFARDLGGVTEMRAGVFVFFDLVMAGIGVCTLDDIALSVLATVIGHQHDRGWILIDAGWMALSRDRGTAKQEVDRGYGVVCDVEGKPFEDLLVTETNQEHGIVALRPGSQAKMPELAVGSLVRILPNHACATGAQHDRYHVLSAGSRRLSAEWQRFRGW